MYWDVFKNLGLKEDLKPKYTSIKRFGKMNVLMASKITIPIPLGSHAQATTFQVDFTVVQFT